ncbi:MAG TPA: 6-pyruvoyl-tetrahydropterin synthase-related protein, partial [Burkholderiales bacterium]|nr:6-pyruvoyl-tetrahydropterin synthase-related protein [Burkholderiales bacterium]
MDSLIINNYPPLSFYLMAGIERLSIDAIDAGRALSLLATLVAAIAVGACVRQLGGTPIAAWVGGLWFLATMMRFFDGYVGKNDPHLPALALMLWALVWLLRRMSAGRSAEAPLILMAVAGFYKHSLIATPFTALWWLFHKTDRLAARASIVAGAAAIAGLTLCTTLYGRAFFDQLLFPRE